MDISVLSIANLIRNVRNIYLIDELYKKQIFCNNLSENKKQLPRPSNNRHTNTTDN